MTGKQRPIDAPPPPWRLSPNNEEANESAESEDAITTADAEAEEATVEDKVMLARRLAAEAKAKMEQRDESPPAKAKKKKKKRARKKAPTTESAPDTRSLSKRAVPPKKLSAQEALAAALAAEPTKPAPTPEAPAPAPAPAPAEATPASSHETDLGAILTANVPGSSLVGPLRVVANPKVFTALWRAHRSRAQQAGDLPLIVTATTLLDAISRGQLTAGRLKTGDGEWAIWCDEAGTLLGAAQPADTYLAGL